MQKRKSILVIGFGAILAVCSGAAGETVKVSQFGFDPEDSTRFVQAALDSGAKCVVFDNRGAPWIVRPLKARSNTDILFEDGVELLAKRGEFRGKRDYLLDMSNVTNCTIRGLGEKGGVLRMHKADYQKPPYEHSEWRYALSLLGAVCVNVENMSFIASGGDGICIGRAARDIVIRKCRCVDNHRQGISVCSVKNLLIEDTYLANTRGTPPSAGIDFEPDRPSERIANCIMRNCRIEGNAGKGIDIFLPKLEKCSEDVGIRIENCHISGNSTGTAITGGPEDFENNGPKGSIVFSGCTFAGNRIGAIGIQRKPTNLTLRFEDCTVTNEKAGVWLSTTKWDGAIPDGMAFSNLVFYAAQEQDWYKARPNERGLVAKVPSNIVGNVTIVRPNGCSEQKAITQKWADEVFAIDCQTPPKRISGLPPIDVCKVQDSKPGEMVELSPFELLWQFKYVFFAERAGKVRFRARLVPKSEKYFHVPSATLRLYRSPSSKKVLKTVELSGVEPVDFEIDVAERGFYVLSNKAVRERMLIEAADVPVAVYVGDRQQLAFVSNSKKQSMWVYVPEKSNGLAFVTKGGTDSFLGASLIAPDGITASQKPQIENWDVLQQKDPMAGLWRIDVCKPQAGNRKYFYVDLTGVPGLIWLSREKTVAFGAVAK